VVKQTLSTKKKPEKGKDKTMKMLIAKVEIRESIMV
jgi:hypothetical protein